MVAAASFEPGQIVILAGLVALLAVVKVVRLVANRQRLRTFCVQCESRFQGVGCMNFAGFREMTCPLCGATGLYPLPKWMVITYAVVLVGLPVFAVVDAVTNPKWDPPLGGLWILILPVALVVNHRLWRRLRAIAARSPGGALPMERVGPASDSASTSGASLE